MVIPAHPLALTAERKLDERRQRALTRYYAAAGAGGIAVGVHTTQFEIRTAGIDLLRPVLELAADTAPEVSCWRIGGKEMAALFFAHGCSRFAGPARARGEAEE